MSCNRFVRRGKLDADLDWVKQGDLACQADTAGIRLIWRCRHLRAVDAAARTTILRPLLSLDKRTIIDMAREVGTADLSARAREGCNLEEGMPVAVQAPVDKVLAAMSQLDESALNEAVETRQVSSLRLGSRSVPNR